MTVVLGEMNGARVSRPDCKAQPTTALGGWYASIQTEVVTNSRGGGGWEGLGVCHIPSGWRPPGPD